MPTKAERTKAFIIETIAPVFNRHGYAGTSMSDLTAATGLTKGALYGNFENKEALAMAAFEYHSKLLLEAVSEKLESPGTALEKLYVLTDFFRHYDEFIAPLGGCPILNTAIDSRDNMPILSAAAREMIRTLEGKIAAVLEKGVHNNELKLPVTPLQFAKQLYTMLQGAVAMSTMTQDRKYLLNTVAYIELLVRKELKA